MLDALKNIAKNAMRLDENEIVRASLDNTQIQHDIVSLNREQLYEQGVFADGKPTGQYAPFTLNYKINEAGALGRDTKTDHVTYKDTGQLYESMRFNNGTDEFTITGNTVKEGVDLQQRDGDVIGLTDQSKAEVSRYLTEPIINHLKHQLLKR